MWCGQEHPGPAVTNSPGSGGQGGSWEHSSSPPGDGLNSLIAAGSAAVHPLLSRATSTQPLPALPRAPLQIKHNHSEFLFSLATHSFGEDTLYSNNSRKLSGTYPGLPLRTEAPEEAQMKQHNSAKERALPQTPCASRVPFTPRLWGGGEDDTSLTGRASGAGAAAAQDPPDLTL